MPKIESSFKDIPVKTAYEVSLEEVGMVLADGSLLWLDPVSCPRGMLLGVRIPNPQEIRWWPDLPDPEKECQ